MSIERDLERLSLGIQMITESIEDTNDEDRNQLLTEMKDLGLEFKRVANSLGINDEGSYQTVENSKEHQQILKFIELNTQVKELKKKLLESIS